MSLSGKVRMWRSAAVAAVAVIILAATALPAHATISDKRNDYNNDGISDLLAISLNDFCLYRWSGVSGGELGNAVQVGCDGWRPYRGTLAAPGDLNRDGVGDLVAIHEEWPHCLVRWLGNGRGGFDSAMQIGCGWSEFIFALAGAGDLNNDGNGDIVSVHYHNTCLYGWFGDGSGGFRSAVQLSCGWGNYVGTMTGAGDLNNDGNADLVAINKSTECLVRWFGNGRGGFDTGVQLGCGWGAYLGTGNLSGMGAMNGNGHGDLLAITDGGTGTDCMHRYFGNGRGGYGPPTQLGCGWNRYVVAP